jgi:chromosomal replication initiation ATPase DnaA
MTTPAQILAAVHQVTGCDPAEIVSKSRRNSVLFPRFIALLLLRESRPFFSDIELGHLIGIEGHGTARYGL